MAIQYMQDLLTHNPNDMKRHQGRPNAFRRGSRCIFLFWHVLDTIRSHIRIDLEVLQELEKEPTAKARRVVVKVVAENQGLTPKRVAYAALLVGKSDAFIDELASSICEGQGVELSTRHRPLQQLFRLKIDTELRSKKDGTFIVPLPFFYLDQVQIGNEKIQYKCILKNEWLAVENENRIFLVFYAVEALNILRWRVTSDLVRVR